MSNVKIVGGPNRTMMGAVVEQTWTTIAADMDGVVQKDEIGKRKITRRVYFAYKEEAENWLVEQRKEGFVGTYPIPAATLYFGDTDSPSNCWSIEVSKEIS